LRVRYTTSEKGKPQKQAEIYTAQEHGIPENLIDQDAVAAARRLNRAGHECYVVGGAVRDLLLGRKPKDFDLVTDAYPRRIKKLFRNAWIIGRRFRLVHLRYPDDKIIELATFRSDEVPSGKTNNEYGTLAQDVYRRDFSLNALYYDPVTREITDFVGGLGDIRKHIIRPVVPLSYTFDEDPVRMLRAVKYSITTNSKIPGPVKRKIHQCAPLLAQCSLSRLAEELFKILQSGESGPILEAVHRHKLLVPLLPEVGKRMEANRNLAKKIIDSLSDLDERKAEGHKVSRGDMLAALLRPLLEEDKFFSEPQPPIIEAVLQLKSYLLPLIAPNKDVEDALRIIFRENGIPLPKKRRSRSSQPRRRRNSGSHRQSTPS